MAQDRVEAVERALTVMDVFDSGEGYSLAALAGHTGFYKSTLLRLLGSLARFGYVCRTEDGRWQLGETPARLARCYAGGQGLLVRVEPCLTALAEQLGETAALVEATPRGAECRLAVLPDQALRHDLYAGMQWACETPDSPCPVIPGGVMLSVALPQSRPKRWLTLSGPAGRVPETRALALLEEAVARLTADDQPGSASTTA